MRRRVWWGGIVVLGLALLIQLVPYGHDHTNPAVTRDAPWSNAAARRLAVAACYDCHSNETRRGWYTNVAPVSWYVQHDVDDGRDALNFSTWDRPQRADELAEAVQEGGMPPGSYTRIHSAARLSPTERRTLAQALRDLPPPG